MAGCKDCPVGKYSLITGGTNQSSCTSCPAGKYSGILGASSASFCQDCAASKYSLSGYAICTDCPRLSTSQEASDGPEQCHCPAGYWAPVGADCFACAAGKYLSDDGHRLDDCISCDPGQYSQSGATVCLYCALGKFSNAAGSSTCAMCGVDSYIDVPGSSFCKNCSMDFCTTGEYRFRCPRGAIQNSFCASCTYKKAHTMFISHGEYNDTCPYVCTPPYKEDCATGECKRCDPGTYALGVSDNDGIEWSCRSCPSGGECDGSEDVVCSSQSYRIFPQWTEVPKSNLQQCMQCPKGLLCGNGVCSVENGTFTCPDASTQIVGEWKQPKERGSFELISCPRGHSKQVLVQEKMECKQCAPFLQYILEPDRDNCQRCPPGLICHGDDQIIPTVNGSEWTVQNHIFRLLACPTGYSVWPAISGVLFDPDVDASQQECRECPEGRECLLDRCLQCDLCPVGKFKDTVGTGPCRSCEIAKYNPLTGSASEALCLHCPEGSVTPAAGQDELSDCVCINTHYMTSSRSGPLGMRCYPCPAAAMCADGTCGFRNPGFSCDGIGSHLKPFVVGNWMRGHDERYRLISCPTGHRLVNETGYESQECFKCPPSAYIIKSTDPLYKCYACPPGAVCPNGGPPIFPEVRDGIRIAI